MDRSTTGHPTNQLAGDARKDAELRAPTIREMRIIMARCGVIDPENIEDYIADDGYLALGKVMTEMTPREVKVLKAGLRGRGGAGFPTGRQWEFATNQTSARRCYRCDLEWLERVGEPLPVSSER